MALGLVHQLQIYLHVAQCLALTYMDGLCRCDVPIQENHSISVIKAPIGCTDRIKASTWALDVSLLVRKDITHFQHKYHYIVLDVPIGII